MPIFLNKCDAKKLKIPAVQIGANAEHQMIT